MRPRLVLCLAAFAFAIGCGEDEPEPAPVSATPDPAHAQEVKQDPYALTCGDLERQPGSPESQELVIEAEFALAREPALAKRVEGMTENRAGRSVYWALTEFCKGRDPTFQPARLAVEAVRQGKYLVQPRPETWNRP
jgi:hypothetical protein